MNLREKLEADIKIHESVGAHAKVERLKGILSGMDAVVVPEETDREELAPESIAPDPDAPLRLAYKMHQSGSSWKIIAEDTGVKAPWIKVKKYASDNKLPYSPQK